MNTKPEDAAVIREWEKDKEKRKLEHEAGAAGMNKFLEKFLQNDKVRLSVKEGLRQARDNNPITRYNISDEAGFNVFKDDNDPLIKGDGGFSDEDEDFDFRDLFRR